jgi:hypothetical protein
MPEHLSEAQIGARMVVVRRDDYEDTNDEVSSAHWCVAIAFAPVLMLHLLRYCCATFSSCQRNSIRKKIRKARKQTQVVFGLEGAGPDRYQVIATSLFSPNIKAEVEDDYAR